MMIFLRLQSMQMRQQSNVLTAQMRSKTSHNADTAAVELFLHKQQIAYQYIPIWVHPTWWQLRPLELEAEQLRLLQQDKHEWLQCGGIQV